MNDVSAAWLVRIKGSSCIVIGMIPSPLMKTGPNMRVTLHSVRNGQVRIIDIYSRRGSASGLDGPYGCGPSSP
jgi:hypothetical protein